MEIISKVAIYRMDFERGACIVFVLIGADFIVRIRAVIRNMPSHAAFVNKEAAPNRL